MPLPLAIAAGLWSTLFTTIVPLGVRLLAGLGFGFVTYQVSDAIFAQAQTYVTSNYAGIPADVLAIMNIAGVSMAINMIFSAYAANLSIKIAMGVFEKFTAKRAWSN